MIEERYIDITFNNGETWRIHVNPIALDRARYYATHDCDDDASLNFDTVVEDEMNYVLSSNGYDDLIDYMQNNCNWADLEKELIKSEAVVDRYDEWFSSVEYEYAPVGKWK